MNQSFALSCVIIDQTFNDNYQSLFNKVYSGKIRLTHKLSIERVIAGNMHMGMGHSLMGTINEGTLIFDIYMYSQDDVLEKLSANAKVLTLFIDHEQGIYIFSLYENGKKLRDTYSDEEVREVGEPLEAEITSSHPLMAIEKLVKQLTGTELSELDKYHYYAYESETF
ncbi:hypothetical protein AB9P05_21505 [Roseivirga sp. BDSF3-8]|uniref:hypothetical protein n=1 Tax=Roseivirga sp. BDSF3-8 TaxID=3241598 RepID=UPI003532080B